MKVYVSAFVSLHTINLYKSYWIFKLHFVPRKLSISGVFYFKTTWDKMELYIYVYTNYTNEGNSLSIKSKVTDIVQKSFSPILDYYANIFFFLKYILKFSFPSP